MFSDSDDYEAEGYEGYLRGAADNVEEENLFGDYTESNREVVHDNTWTETTGAVVHDLEGDDQWLGENANEDYADEDTTGYEAYGFEEIVDPALLDFSDGAYENDLETHSHSGGLDFDEHENTPIAADALFNPHHIHDPDTCSDCQAEALEDADMGIEMIGFALFGVVLFVMWYMLRSCKDKKREDSCDPSNP